MYPYPLRHEVRSIFNLWSTMLAETRRMARDRASLAEVMAVEMTARLDILMKDVAFVAKKVRVHTLCVAVHCVEYVNAIVCVSACGSLSIS